MAFDDRTGQQFVRWTVVGLNPKSGRRKYWDCVCVCGEARAVLAYSLTSGASRSCGCLADEETVDRLTIHGMHKHPAYNSWKKARDRCHRPNEPGYADYGGRGITFHDAWNDFQKFWEDMGPTWAPGLSIDRVRVNGNYEPRNVRWATPLEQGNNRRNNQIIPTPIGPMTVSDAAREFGVNRNAIFRRIRDGWPRDRLIEKAQFHPRWHNKT